MKQLTKMLKQIKYLVYELKKMVRFKVILTGNKEHSTKNSKHYYL